MGGIEQIHQDQHEGQVDGPQDLGGYGPDAGIDLEQGKGDHDQAQHKSHGAFNLVAVGGFLVVFFQHRFGFQPCDFLFAHTLCADIEFVQGIDFVGFFLFLLE